MSEKKAELPLSEFCMVDANYIAERIGELHSHAYLHDGELCAKLARARIGGMIEVLNRMGLEVDCHWDRYDRNVSIMTDTQWIQHKQQMYPRVEARCNHG